MKAITTARYGSTDVLEFRDVESPDPDADRVQIRVHAAAVNPLDWHFMTGTPYVLRLVAGLRRPKQPIRGVDLAGVITGVGADVSDWQVGDRVFGGGPGSFAESVCAKADTIARIPDGLSFADAAAAPVAAITALQALRDHATVGDGSSVLVNGSSGGVGTYAVQIAKAWGAHVTAVCSTRNVELVRSLGADEVVDYRTDDFVDGGERFDVIIDNVGNRTPSECRSVLRPGGTYVIIGPPKHGKWVGPMLYPLRAKASFAFRPQRATSFTANETRADLEVIAGLFESGQLRSVIDRHYPLSATADAIEQLAGGHARGKIIIDVHDPTE